MLVFHYQAQRDPSRWPPTPPTDRPWAEIQCWVDLDDPRQAQRVAHFKLLELGWIPRELEDIHRGSAPYGAETAETRACHRTARLEGKAARVLSRRGVPHPRAGLRQVS